MSRRLTDLQLERFLADAMSPAEKSSVEKVLAASPADAEALRELRADSEAFLLTNAPAPFIEKVMPTPKPSVLRFWWAALVAVAAAVALVFVTRPPVDDETRVKGDVAWAVRVNERTALEGMNVHPGDTLTFQVAAAEPTWVAVVSHAPDGWFVYVPAMVAPKGVSVLPTGARLDEQRGRETLFLISADHPIDAEDAKAVLEGDVATDLRVEKVSITKN